MRRKVSKYALAATIAVLALSALGMDLRAAKNAELVGEMENGYLGIVRADAPAAARALVDDVNAKRRARYRRIADDNGIALADVETRAGQRAIERTQPSRYVKVSGRWRRK